MLEPYSEEEKEYIRYLLRKYLPSVYADIERTSDSAVMFDDKKDALKEIDNI